jgi:hypothetical protein
LGIPHPDPSIYGHILREGFGYNVSFDLRLLIGGFWDFDRQKKPVENRDWFAISL